MKKNTTFVIAFFIVISTFGQRFKDKYLTHRNSENNTTLQNRSKFHPLSFRSTLPGEKLDSVSATDGTYAMVFSYDENGLQTEYKEYDYDTVAAVKYLTFKTVYTYDNSGNNLSETEFKRNNSTQPLALAYRIICTYNSNNKKLSEEDISYDTVNKFKTKLTYEYDVTGNITTKYFSIADTNYSKEVFAYNGNNLPIIDDHYSWQQDAYKLTYSDTIKYDANNNDTLTISATSEKTKKIFDANNNLLTEITSYSQYDTSIQAYKWKISHKDEYTYSNNKETSFTSYIWNDSTAAWGHNVYSEKHESVYDVNGNQIQSIEYKYDTTSSQFVPTYKSTYSFNLTKNSSDALFALYETEDPNRITAETDYKYNSGNWVNDGTYNYYYSAFSVCGEYFSTSYDSATNVFTLVLNSNTTANATSYLWDFGDGSTSTQAKPSHTFANDEYYNVCLKLTGVGNDTCSYCHVIGKDSEGNVLRTKGFSMVVKNQNDLSGIAIQNESNDILVYPNPASDNISVNINSAGIFQLINAQGQIVMTKNLASTSTVSLTNVPQGIYIYKIQDNQAGIKIGKLLVE